jgi:hypothetical protein
MADPFMDYGKRATSSAPAKLLGPMKTRAQLRMAYNDAVELLHACATPESVAMWEMRHRALITQFHAEHEFFWSGDGDFLGLEREIERAKARVDDRLDMPRWDN